jgi:putative glutamine amidotransferase
MAHWVMRRDAIALMIPARGLRGAAPARRRCRRARLDALVLMGGSTCAPRPGEKALRRNGAAIASAMNTDRAAAPRRAARAVGICRGLQVVNVAFGGTLYQDVGTQSRPRSSTATGTYTRTIRTPHRSSPARVGASYPCCRWSRPTRCTSRRRTSAAACASAWSGPTAWSRPCAGTDRVRGAVAPEFHPQDESSFIDDRPILDDFARARH